LHSQDEWTLASLDVIANQAKSLILALAIHSGLLLQQNDTLHVCSLLSFYEIGTLSSQEAVKASRAEEDHQISQWGEGSTS